MSFTRTHLDTRCCVDVSDQIASDAEVAHSPFGDTFGDGGPVVLLLIVLLLCGKLRSQRIRSLITTYQ